MENPEDEITTGFPVLFTREEFKQDILETMLALASKANFTFMAAASGSLAESNERVWSLLTTKPYRNAPLADPGLSPQDLGLTFSDVERLEAVRALVYLYDYAVQGVSDPSNGRIDYCDGYENQLSRIIFDLHHSTFLQEWGDLGASQSRITKSVERCLYVCELANARLMLEGSDDGFFLDDRSEGFLSIRQMSLLSGMTEASLRTLANPKRKNALRTTKHADGTAIDIDTAKTWLISKGRYVPIKKARSLGSEDFTNRKFLSTQEFEDAIATRLEFLNFQHGEKTVNSRIENTGVFPIFLEVVPGVPIGRHVIGEKQLLDAGLMHQLAAALELPAELFALRAAEAVAQDRLRAIEQQVKQALQTK
jgi:hypothetical protein